ncbi:hypothetical protein EGW08_000574 [Elysia chlorotica]|uniref:Fucosyltransferase n=1 Tax=Elysia chlorotica TaxID=188477 RepID=A0A433UCM1_ELYCH|nr:hypothetical protein EGW08_000574 [Elysia chlorotica]
MQVSYFTAGKTTQDADFQILPQRPPAEVQRSTNQTYEEDKALLLRQRQQRQPSLRSRSEDSVSRPPPSPPQLDLLHQPIILSNDGRSHVRESPQSLSESRWESSAFLKTSEFADGDLDLDLDVDAEPKSNGKSVLRKPETEKVRTFATVFPCDKGEPSCYVQKRYSVDTCPHKCKQVSNLTEADFVVFYVFKITSNDIVPDFRRPPGQRWVMFDTEPPCRKRNHSMLDLPRLKGQFNWTLSYRLDADIPWLYGYLRVLKDPPRKDYDAIFRRKSVTAAWFVGHCATGSRRDVYAKYMQEYGGLDLHIYGACGNYTCQGDCNGNSSVCKKAQLKRGSDNEKCLPLLSEKYFFYLAFENSLCKDYVTEKFFKIFKNVDTIPVLRGGADHKRLFPPNTFVDAADFASPADLAVYLKELSRNRWRYTEMLREKNKYRFEPSGKWFCKLCEKIHSDTADRVQWYPDLRSWYVKDQCRKPDDLMAQSPGSQSEVGLSTYLRT